MTLPDALSSGNHKPPSSTSPVVNAQSLAKASCNWATTGRQLGNANPARDSWLVGEDVAVADVHAAGEGDDAIHDQRFAVVAEIDGGDAPGREQGGGQEFGKRIFA